MSLVASLAEQSVEMQQEVDNLGGASGPIESGVYPMVIDVAYFIKSAGGALGLVVHGKVQTVGGSTREIKQTEYVTSGDAKGNKKFYVRDGKNYPLPGYSWGNNLCLLGAGVSIDAIETAIKTVKVYNYDAKAEIPEEKEVLVGLLGKTVLAGIQHQIQNKTAKDQVTNKYVNVWEDDEPVVKELNVITQVFHEGTKRTVPEVLAKIDTAKFYDDWVTKWSGKTRDLVNKKRPEGNGSITGNSTTAPVPEISLFTG